MPVTFDLGARACFVLLALSACSSRGNAGGPTTAPPPEPALPVLPEPPAPRASPPAAAGPFFVADPSARAVPIRRAGAPNMRYASLDRAACEAELTRRAVPYVVGEPTEGVLAPVRLRGPLHGVLLHTDRAPKEREKSKYELFDCRLVLALDDFTEMVARRDVTEIIHFNAFRPKTEYGCTAKYWGLQHCAALAVDVRELRRKDGTALNVDRDFHGHIGLGTCATGVGPSPQTKAAGELWSILCDAADRALFNVMLTPNYNAEHKNHFHLEITPDAGWMMVK